MNNTAFKSCKSSSKAYEALADAFQQLNNLPKLKAQVNAGTDIWAEVSLFYHRALWMKHVCLFHTIMLTDGQDGNTGLVEELVEHQNRAYLSRLSRTFSAIPVSNIASSVGSSVEQVTTFVDSLIQQGLLNARLDDSAAGKCSAPHVFRVGDARRDGRMFGAASSPWKLIDLQAPYYVSISTPHSDPLPRRRSSSSMHCLIRRSGRTCWPSRSKTPTIG